MKGGREKERGGGMEGGREEGREGWREGEKERGATLYGNVSDHVQSHV